ncbi:lysozyme inhibitor LprI family protein [Rhizobium sp. YIM 134829]|uniref:lysozyme inhibitor LprI family protein n=1 Tax=Rhizobium sp. YIM 134829 TaxID=3390453 RepID=UPI00397CA3EB
MMLLPASAGAQDAPAVACSEAVTQADMTICARQDYGEADQALNTAYRNAMTRAIAMDKDLADLGEGMTGAAEALRAAQRAWIPYRDGQCALVGFSARGGSMEPMLVAQCLADLSRARTKELDAALVAQ